MASMTQIDPPHVTALREENINPQHSWLTSIYIVFIDWNLYLVILAPKTFINTKPGDQFNNSS